MKKLQRIVLSFCLVLSLLFCPTIETHASNVSLGVSASKINIGDTVTVSVTVPDSVSATVDLSYSTKVVSFVSASADVGSNGGTITMNVGKYSLAASNTISVTFKATTSGKAKFSASVVSAVDNDTAEEVSLGGASTSVTVENQAVEEPDNPPEEQPDNPPAEEPEAPKSEDNSLSSLKLSSGSLSPSFKYNVTKYTATVGYNVDSVVVSATASNEKATIESVTGNGNVKLNVGENTIQVVVQAENGVKATYTIVVTREDEAETTPNTSESDSSESESSESESSESESEDTSDENEMLQWNGQMLQPAGDIPKDIIPKDFSKNTVMINSVEMPCLVFENGELKVLYLANEEGTAGLYVYEEAQQLVYPFVKLQSNDNYVVVLLPDEANRPAPENYKPCTLSIEGKGVINAYQFVQPAESQGETSWFGPEEFFAAEPVVTDFYLIYGMNNTGETGWYVYDSVEGTVQRYLGSVHNPITDTGVESEDTSGTANNEEYDALAAKLKQAENMQMIILCVAVFVVVVLVIIIVNLILRGRLDDEYDDEYEEDDDEYDEEYEFEEDEDTTEESAPNEADEEIEIEFYEMPQAEVLSEEAELHEADEEIEIEFYEMPQTEKVSEEVESDEADEEIEIEFYEMPQTERVSEEVESDVTDEEIEIEFYEMPQNEIKEESKEETKDDEKVEVEFYDMEELLMKEAFADEEVPSKNEEKIPEKQQPIASEPIKNKGVYIDDDDDDLEFIELD